MIVKILTRMGPEASARLRRESSRFKRIAQSRPLTEQEAALAFFHVAPKTFETVAAHPEWPVKHMVGIADKRFKFEVLPGSGKNPPLEWHQKRHEIYADRLADDLKAGHRGGADYWQGATSAESSALAWQRNPRRIFSRLYRLWLKAKKAIGWGPCKMPWKEKGVYWGLAIQFPPEEGWEEFAGYSAHQLGQEVTYADKDLGQRVVTIGFTFPTEEDAILASSIIQREIYKYKIQPTRMKVIQVVHKKIAEEYDPLNMGHRRNISQEVRSYQVVFTRGINALSEDLGGRIMQAAMILGGESGPEPSMMILDPMATGQSTEDQNRTIRMPWRGKNKVYIKKDDYLNVPPKYKKGIKGRYLVTAMLAEEY